MKSVVREINGIKKINNKAVNVPSRREVRKMDISNEKELNMELRQLAGERYSRKGGIPGHVRYGNNPGTVFLQVGRFR